MYTFNAYFHSLALNQTRGILISVSSFIRLCLSFQKIRSLHKLCFSFPPHSKLCSACDSCFSPSEEESDVRQVRGGGAKRGRSPGVRGERGVVRSVRLPREPQQNLPALLRWRQPVRW